MSRFMQYVIFACLGACLLLSGCAIPTETVDTSYDKGKAVMGLDYRDFENAASDMVESMLSSGAVNKPDGGRYVMVISRITNDTMQRIDTDQLVKKIRVELLRSGKVVTTTAVGLDGPEDQMVMAARDLRHSDEFDQSRGTVKGQLIKPELSLSGKIIQRNNRIDKRRQQVDYYFQMTMTDIATGLAWWEDEKPIVKRGSSKSVSW
jgi:uncharacterized protein (TIGR02722 family)